MVGYLEAIFNMYVDEAWKMGWFDKYTFSRYSTVKLKQEK